MHWNQKERNLPSFLPNANVTKIIEVLFSQAEPMEIFQFNKYNQIIQGDFWKCLREHNYDIISNSLDMFTISERIIEISHCWFKKS